MIVNRIQSSNFVFQFVEKACQEIQYILYNVKYEQHRENENYIPQSTCIDYSCCIYWFICDRRSQATPRSLVMVYIENI